MKRCLAILCVVALALPLASCRKNDTPEPVGADNAVGPSVITAKPNPSLGESQVTISSKAEAARTSAGMAAPTTPTPTTPEAATAPAPASTVPAESITAIKAVLEQMKAFVAANPNELPVQFMADDVAPAAKIAQQALKDLPVKAEALKSAMTAKGIPMPENFEKGMDKMKEGVFNIALLKAAPDTLKFELQGDKVIVTPPQGDKEAFVNTPTGWKYTAVSADDAKKAAMVAELLPGSVKVLDGLIAGVNDGSITKDNFSAKQEELSKQFVLPVLEKVMKSAMGTTPTPAATSPEAPATPAAPTTPATPATETPATPAAPAAETPAATTAPATETPAAPAAPATETPTTPATPAAPAAPAADAPAAPAADAPKAEEKKPVDTKGALKAITNPGGE